MAMMLAALKWHRPCFGRLGASALPRASRAIRPYGVKRPPQQSLPLPWVVVCAIIGVLLSRDHAPIAIHIIMAFRACLRPGASDPLRVESLVPPSAVAGLQYRHWGLWLNHVEGLIPGKTGLFNMALLFDTLGWLDPFFRLLVENRDQNAFLWPHSVLALLNELAFATRVLIIECLNPCRYALRHGGASEDLSSGSGT